MLRVWGTPDSRPTRDIYLLGYVENEVEILEQVVKQICEVPVENDGLRFDAGTVRGEFIKVDADYKGVRVKLAGFLERARIPIQVNIGFGDAV